MSLEDTNTTLHHPFDSLYEKMTQHGGGKAFPSPKFTVDPSLERWNKSPKECLLRDGKDQAWDGLASACIVFNADDRVLMIQRASHDSLPNRWELPGGAVDDDDPTVLHGAARELWEEAGLVARHFSHLVTQGQGRSAEETFSNRIKTKIFARYTFAIDVESCEHVQLDPNEHQNYVWVTAENVRAQKAGDHELIVTKEMVAAIVLEAFRLRQKKFQAL